MEWTKLYLSHDYPLENALTVPLLDLETASWKAWSWARLWFISPMWSNSQIIQDGVYSWSKLCHWRLCDYYGCRLFTSRMFLHSLCRRIYIRCSQSLSLNLSGEASFRMVCLGFSLTVVVQTSKGTQPGHCNGYAVPFYSNTICFRFKTWRRSWLGF